MDESVVRHVRTIVGGVVIGVAAFFAVTCCFFATGLYSPNILRQAPLHGALAGCLAGILASNTRMRPVHAGLLVATVAMTPFLALKLAVMMSNPVVSVTSAALSLVCGCVYVLASGYWTGFATVQRAQR